MILTAFFFISCAYFNTFYNAQQYFDEAEEDIVKNRDTDELSKKTDESLAKAIEKCNTVLRDFPESRWRDDALILKGKALYYKGKYATAKATLERLNSEHSESVLLPEANLWLVRCRWKLGEGDASLQALLSLMSKAGERVKGSIIARWTVIGAPDSGRYLSRASTGRFSAVALRSIRRLHAWFIEPLKRLLQSG